MSWKWEVKREGKGGEENIMEVHCMLHENITMKFT
jgi:hypothetical protein